MKKKYHITILQKGKELEKECHTSNIGRLMQNMANHGFFVLNYHEVSNNLIEVPLGKGGKINDVLL